MSATKIVVSGAARTPIGAIGGGLSPLNPRDLLLVAANAAIAHAKLDPKLIEYVTVGQGLQDVRNMNMASVIKAKVGAPTLAPATTVQENCASGGAAIHDICRRLLLGEIHLGLAGGVESMSQFPRYLFQGRTAAQLYGSFDLIDGVQGALADNFLTKYPKGVLMGRLTEDLAEKYGVSRELQDEIAYNSHKNAIETWEKGLYSYVTPVEVPHRKKTVTISKDEGPKKLDMEYFKKQKPYFKKEGGTITNANSSSVNDGAATVVLTTEKYAKEVGLPILAELKAFGNIGVPAEYMGEGAFKVLPKLFKKAGISLKDVDYFEMNEAFAAVVGGATKEFPELKLEKANQWGSGVSLGHPVGCTGCRQVVDMVHQLRLRDKKIGVTSRCVGGGIGSGEVLIRYD